jgi:hypothetical protein
MFYGQRTALLTRFSLFKQAHVTTGAHLPLLFLLALQSDTGRL